jgi:hypothetical protein
MTLELDFRNQGRGPLSIDPTGIEILDAKGVALPIYDAFGKPRFDGVPPGQLATIEEGQSRRLYADFVVNPRSDGLRTLSVRQRKVMRNGVPIAVTFKFQRM